MSEIIKIRKNTYFDSVTLMTLSSKLLKQEGIQEAVVSMATPMNKELLENVGMMNDEVADAGNNDLIIAFKGDTPEACDAGYAMVDQLLGVKKSSTLKGEVPNPRNIREAVKLDDDLNLAIISVAGEFAAREARESVKNGMHVMLFSDNVTEDHELELKMMAHERGLLFMGPDCGTAIINNVGLCFANKVKAGVIGLVGASGTGLQEVTVLIDNMGEGISQAIGTGGRDLYEKIGGIMFLDAFGALKNDQNTQVIVLISKPPARNVAEKIMAEVRSCTKPVVVCFIAGDESLVAGTDAIFATSLEDAATKAVQLTRGVPVSRSHGSTFELPMKEIAACRSSLKDEQRYIRGLFCGGTLTAEAVTAISHRFEKVYSNVAKKPEQKLSNPKISKGHTLIDLGDDLFTVGRPHPMIEPTLRLDRLLQEAADPEVAVILMDFELGFGSHEDPVGVTLETIREAKVVAAQQGRSISMVAYVLGTKGDDQGLDSQRAMLEAEGVIVAQSNLQAVEIAIEIAGSKG